MLLQMPSKSWTSLLRPYYALVKPLSHPHKTFVTPLLRPYHTLIILSEVRDAASEALEVVIPLYHITFWLVYMEDVSSFIVIHLSKNHHYHHQEMFMFIFIYDYLFEYICRSAWCGFRCPWSSEWSPRLWKGMNQN
jgi:hypothetical protein